MFDPGIIYSCNGSVLYLSAGAAWGSGGGNGIARIQSVMCGCQMGCDCVPLRRKIVCQVCVVFKPSSVIKAAL